MAGLPKVNWRKQQEKQIKKIGLLLAWRSKGAMLFIELQVIKGESSQLS